MSELLVKKKTRGRPKKEHKVIGKMMKVAERHLEQLKEIRDVEGKASLAEVIDFLLTTHTFVKNSKKSFIVDDRLLEDSTLNVARGAAILNAVKEGRPPTLPKIMLYLGEDDGF